MADPYAKPRPMPLHMLYFVLYLLALFCGLWQHGHPLLTIGLLAGALPAGLIARIPRRYFHEELRLISQYLVVGCAMAWAMYRFGTQPPVDLLLIEVFAILAFSFAFTMPREGYYYLLMVSVILLFYGSLNPTREVFIWCMPVAVILCMWLLYQTRVASLANRSGVDTHGTLTWRVWPWIALHAAIVLVLWGVLVAVYPTPIGQSRGVAPSSFQSRNRHPLPPLLSQWFRSPHRESSPEGRELMDGKRPDTLVEQARMAVPGGNGRNLDSFGAGSGQPGKDLVMRVRSPVKLYWLGKLYDRYDGEQWERSPALRRQRLARETIGEQTAKTVRVHFQIEKWVSPTLFCPYLRLGHISTTQHGVRLNLTFEGAQLADRETPQPIPFLYDTISIIDFHLQTSVPGSQLPGWYEEIPPQNYLELPMKRISPRLRDLAFQLTATQPDPLAKAYALRDHLRSNYTYSLSTPPPPGGVEPVDWFLFEQKQGHCEYYAASLAVLARLAGLPSRVATGFAPGNYNVLTGVFEVFEYHAHAWTQIFIPNMGWLTMDATPPGSTPVQSRTSPVMIGGLRDPFTDEWKIRTPELSSDTQAYIKENLSREKDLERGQGSGRPASGEPDSPPGTTLIGSVFKAVVGAGEVDPDATGPLAAVQRLAFNVKALLERLGDGIRFVLRWLLSLLIAWQTLLGLSLAVAIRLAWPRLARWHRDWRRQRECERWFSEANAQRDAHPEACIAACYRAVCGLLELHGCPRLPSKDLDDYLRDDLADDLRLPAGAVFAVYVKLNYAPCESTRDDARRALDGATELRRQLQLRNGRPG